MHPGLTDNLGTDKIEVGPPRPLGSGGQLVSDPAEGVVEGNGEMVEVGPKVPLVPKDD